MDGGGGDPGQGPPVAQARGRLAGCLWQAKGQISKNSRDRFKRPTPVCLSLPWLWFFLLLLSPTTPSLHVCWHKNSKTPFFLLGFLKGVSTSGNLPFHSFERERERESSEGSRVSFLLLPQTEPPDMEPRSRSWALGLSFIGFFALLFSLGFVQQVRADDVSEYGTVIGIVSCSPALGDSAAAPGPRSRALTQAQ